jgi:putative addiction module component (TIGR02574 family)
MSTAEICDAAKKLPATEKARLAEELLASLDDPGQTDIDTAWAEEVERRIDSLDACESKEIPAEAVFRQIESRDR